MNTSTTSIFEDKTTLTGLIFLAISFALFSFTVNVYDVNFDFFTGAFFANYLLTFIYLIIVFASNKKMFGKKRKFSNFTHNIILLQLFNISAYSLNRSISVFDISANWVIWFLMVSNSLLLIHALRKNFNSNGFNHLIVIMSSIGILFHLYESIYVCQGYIFGILGCWVLFIPLHIFVPILFVIAYSKVLRDFFRSSSKFWTSALIAWSMTLFLIVNISYRFYQTNKTIGETFHLSQKPYEDNTLPSWVRASQQLKKDWITERALKAGISYRTSDRMFNRFGEMSINGRIKHDPLVVIGSIFCETNRVSKDDRLKILRSLYDARHETERKLWSGDNLSTTDIVTNVQLFPEYRLAYTEKTFKIKNSVVARWRSQQEALYTFYMPEGSVVTSAALWVNGKEEPAYLTTKSKADSAYQAIVGRERRDPLLLHWQEGNRFTVRVFPCTPDEDRQFKIGVTTPLKKESDQLIYENIDFEGPYYKDAKESINVVYEGQLDNMDAPFSFSEEGTSHTYIGPYKSDWSLEFDATPLSTNAFSFNGHSYQMKDYVPQKNSFDAKEIYLDINYGWTRSEFNNIWDAVEDKSVYVFANNKMQKVTASNKKSLFKQLQKMNFTLFPFHKIENSQEAIVISKYNQLTPTLSDIDKSIFVKKLSESFKDNASPIKLLNLGDEISPYLKTLKELRAIQLEQVSKTEAVDLLSNNQFYQYQENNQSAVNHYGGFQLNQSAAIGTPDTNAPDHLMRLFAYHNVLRAIGKNYFNKKALANELIQEAKEAYVVTPISSLIVLETQKDYDRFNIKKSKNSLQNASIGNNGAVPEPHEWLLIIIVFFTTLFLYFKNRAA